MTPTATAPAVVAFSMRRLDATVHARLKALADLVSDQVGVRVTVESMAGKALALGVARLEAVLTPPAGPQP